jgi:hypothetical protein
VVPPRCVLRLAEGLSRKEGRKGSEGRWDESKKLLEALVVVFGRKRIKHDFVLPAQLSRFASCVLRQLYVLRFIVAFIVKLPPLLPGLSSFRSVHTLEESLLLAQTLSGKATMLQETRCFLLMPDRANRVCNDM